MDGKIEPQVTSALNFGEVPICDARRAKNQQRAKNKVAGAQADAFREKGSNEASKSNCHGETIPNESRVVGMPVVVSGAEGS